MQNSAFIVTRFAKRNAVRYIKTQLRIVSEWPDVMSIQVATAIIAALLTGELVTGEYIKAPAFICGRKTLTAPIAVFVAMASFAAWCTLTSDLANLDTGFNTVALACSVAAALFCGLAHFLARLIAHSFALHRRHEGFAAFDPCLPNLTFSFF